MSLEVVPNLKEILINSTIQNVKSNIIKLKEVFSTSSNIQYLEYWFIFFEKDFFKKNLKIMEKTVLMNAKIFSESKRRSN